MHIDKLSLAAFGLIVLALGGCSSAPKQAGADVGAGAAKHALEMRGKPYRPGGSSPRGFDCSGLAHNRFVHAPSSGKQVTTASLTDRYWSQHFAGARRPVL